MAKDRKKVLGAAGTAWGDSANVPAEPDIWAAGAVLYKE
jgi:hypothetical protein